MRRCVAVLVLLLALVCAPSAGAAGTGGTSVAIDGGTVTLTVSMDVCCMRTGYDENIAATIFGMYARAAERIWNDQLANLPVCGGLTLKVKIDEKMLHEGDAHRVPFAHQVNMDFTGSGRSTVDTPDQPKYDDNTRPYDLSLNADWYLADMDARTAAHEVGHLLGLGDDYQDATRGSAPGGEPVAIPLPGRWGTLMDTRKGKVDDQVDQELADIIAGLAAEVNKDIPTCERWAGTITGNTTSISDPTLGIICASTVEGTIRFEVSEDSKVTGTSTTSWTFPGDCGGVRPMNGPVFGTASDGEFKIHVPGVGITTGGLTTLTKPRPPRRPAISTRATTETTSYSTSS